MSQLVQVFNRQRTQPVDRAFLARLSRWLLGEHLGLEQYQLGIHLVAAGEMARVNEKYLGHAGSTDVITFDYAESPGADLHGELFVCVDDALHHAKAFHTTWQTEVVRYLVHGVLHLRGFDDLDSMKRRVMKRKENQLVRELGRRFPLSKLKRVRKLAR